MNITELLQKRKEIRRKILYAEDHKAYESAKAELEEIDTLIPWVHYAIIDSTTEHRRDGVELKFSHIRNDLDQKPLSEWTEEELNMLPYDIEDIDLAQIIKK